MAEYSKMSLFRPLEIQTTSLFRPVFGPKWYFPMMAVFDIKTMSLFRPLEIQTTSLFRPVFASPKWYFPYDVVFDIKTTPLIRPLFGSPKGGLNIGILLYI